MILIPSRRLIPHWISSFVNRRPSVVGHTSNQIPANGPVAECNRVFPTDTAFTRWLGKANSRRNCSRLVSSNAVDARNCHPCFHSPRNGSARPPPNRQFPNVYVYVAYVLENAPYVVEYKCGILWVTTYVQIMEVGDDFRSRRETSADF